MSTYWKNFQEQGEKTCFIILTELTFKTDSEIRCAAVSSLRDGAEALRCALQWERILQVNEDDLSDKLENIITLQGRGRWKIQLENPSDWPGFTPDSRRETGIGHQNP